MQSACVYHRAHCASFDVGICYDGVSTQGSDHTRLTPFMSHQFLDLFDFTQSVVYVEELRQYRRRRQNWLQNYLTKSILLLKS